MPFMVIYRTSDGTSKFEQADAIDEAALFVERLRNSDGIDEIRIFRMEEVSFAFRPYYKVELGMPERATPAPPADVVGGATTADEPPASPPVALARRVVDPSLAARTLDEPAADVEAPAPTSASSAPNADPLGEGTGANGARRGLFGR